MNIVIEKNDAPHLVKTKIICDTGLADKLNDYEVLKHLNSHSTTLLENPRVENFAHKFFCLTARISKGL
jgi:hypothetical protein